MPCLHGVNLEKRDSWWDERLTQYHAKGQNETAYRDYRVRHASISKLRSATRCYAREARSRFIQERTASSHGQLFGWKHTHKREVVKTHHNEGDTTTAYAICRGSRCVVVCITASVGHCIARLFEV